jgi:hypothetical protein
VSISKVDENDTTLAGNPYKLDWLNPDINYFPGAGSREIGEPVTIADKLYKFIEPGSSGRKVTITIDNYGPPIHFDICNAFNFSYNFRVGQGVLLADNPPGRKPIHLSFNPPVSALWTQVSAEGDVDTEYRGELDVALANSQIFQVHSSVGTIQKAYGTAPTLGAQATDGQNNGIAEAWIDVVELSTQGVASLFPQIAINDLYFLP